MAAFPGGTPTAADLDAVVPDRPVFLPNRDHHGAWVNSRALEIAGRRRAHPRPARRPVRARRRRPPDRHPPRGRHAARSRGTSRRRAPRTTTPPCWRARPTCTRSASPAGRTRSSGPTPGMDDPGPTYLRAARAGDLTAHVVGALWWDRDRGDEQVADLVARRAEYTHGRFRATSVKIMQDGVAENGTAAMTAPYLDRCGHATANAGHSFVDPGRAAGVRRGAGRRGLPGARARDRRPRRPRGARRLRAPARARGPTCATTSRTSRSCTPTTCAASPALGVAANMQALWACLDEQMAELTLPFLGEERSRLAVPVRRPAPRRRPARRRQRLAGQHPRPAGRDPRRGQPHGVRRAGAGRRRARSCPSRRSTSRPRSRRTPPARPG